MHAGKSKYIILLCALKKGKEYFISRNILLRYAFYDEQKKFLFRRKGIFDLKYRRLTFKVSDAEISKELFYINIKRYKIQIFNILDSYKNFFFDLKLIFKHFLMIEIESITFRISFIVTTENL